MNKLIEKQKKRWNLNLPNQEKRFLSNHHFKLKEIGC